MKERAAVERVIKRIYEDRLRRTGKLPGKAEVREMESKASKAAEEFDNRKTRK